MVISGEKEKGYFLSVRKTFFLEANGKNSKNWEVTK